MPKVIGQIKSIWPDRTQYKPYAYNLEMQNLFVELEVDEAGVVSQQKGDDDEAINTILNLEGFTALLGNIADSLDKMHLASLKAKNRQSAEY